MKAPAIVIAMLASAAGGVFLGCGSNPAVSVGTVQMRQADVVAVLTTNGRIEAGSRYEVFSETTGRVQQTQVRAGDSVDRGQPLALVDDHAAREALEAADARLAAARAELAKLESGLPSAVRADLESRAAQLEVDLREHEIDLRQAERLAEKNAIPAREVQSANRRLESTREELALIRRKLGVQPLDAAVDLARARIREAEAAVSAARRQVGSATIRAPIAGVVYSLSVERGMFVSPGALVARLAGAEAPHARLLIDEPELGKVRLGAEALLSADAFPGDFWTCRIDLLPTEVIEVGTRRVGEARCTVDPSASKGPLERLIPNLTVDVSIAVERAEGVAALPREVVIREGGEEYVWVAEQGRARRRRVEVGVRGGEQVEIRGGLAAGDQVLAPGTETLSDGASVTIDGK